MRCILTAQLPPLMLAALVAGPPVAAAQQPNDYVIVPGVRVGPVGKYTSADALKSLFQGAQIRHGRDGRGDKTSIRIRNAGSGPNAADLIIRWRLKHRVIGKITVLPHIKQWRTVHGLTVGSPLEAAQFVNGRRFPLKKPSSRFVYTEAWGGGKLPAGLGIGFAPPSQQVSQLPSDIHSEHPAVKGKSFRIIGFVVNFK